MARLCVSLTCPVVLATALAAASTASGQEPSPAPSSPAGNPAPARDELPEDGGWISKQVRAALSDHEPGREGFHLGPLYPAVSIPSTGSGPAPTLHLWAPAIRGSRLDVHASAAYSWHRSQYYDLQVGAIPHRAQHKPNLTTGTDSVYPMSDLYKTAGLRRFDLYLNLHHRVYPREEFYGLGPATTVADRSDYTLHDTLVELVSEYRVASWLTISVQGGVLKTSLGHGNNGGVVDTLARFDDRSAPGLVGQPDYIHASVGVLLDNRDQPDNPHRGGTLGIAVTRFDESAGSEFHFNRLTVDGRRFVAIGARRRHVLALHGLGSFDKPDTGGRVPFYLQSALGGAHVLRGFHPFRFRDEDLLALSGEYRLELMPKVELAAFYDAGKVFRRVGDLDLHHLATSWGAGLRLKTLTKVRLRVDVAHSREGTRLIVKFAPAF